MDGPLPQIVGRRLSLVIPAYNEEAGVRQAIVEADEALAQFVEEYEILVVDDGSRDATAAVVAQEAAIRPSVRLLRHEVNRGYGAALRSGFEAARFEFVAFTDADCQFYLKDLGALLALAESHPIVVGWRENRKDTRLRCLASRGYNLLTRSLLGTCVRDCDCALKVFRRGVLATVLPETHGFFVNVEMLTRARQLGYNVAETGVRHRPRLRGKSTVSPRDIPRTLAALLPFWWSSMLFPGASASGGRQFPAVANNGGDDAGRSPLPALLLLLVVACLLFFSQLRAPLLEPQEPRYAEIPRQMLAEGRLLTPVLNGQAYLDKPPLLYWSVITAYEAFGVHGWVARLIPGLAGVLTVLATFLWGRRVAGNRTGLLGALVLCLSWRFVYLERMLTMDGLLCLWVTAGLAAAHAAVVGGRFRWGWWLLSAVACALGLLTKGPVALLLIAVPTAVFAALDRRSAHIGWRRWAAYLAAAAVIAAPWYVFISVAEPDFAASFFWKHNIVRFIAPFDHAEPVWFHLPLLLAGMLPWSLLLPGFVVFLARRSVRAALRRPPALGFFLLAAGWSAAFFSMAGCKRPVYILPTLPPLALALGCYLNALVPVGGIGASWRRLWRGGSRLAYHATLLMLAGAAGAALFAVWHHFIGAAAGYAHIGGAIAVAALVLSYHRKVSWPVCGLATFAVLFVGVLTLQPAYNRQFSLRDCLRNVPRNKPLSVVCYPQQWESVSFYLPQAKVHAYGVNQRDELIQDLRAHPGTLLLAKSGPLMDDLQRDLPGAVQIIRRGRGGAVTAGWVRFPTQPPEDLLAEK
ncbi:MAG TPA: glycosyltransferase [Gemmataceae bacterium]|nr:glycosyltransferase [Gemmataceae bacterium]